MDILKGTEIVGASPYYENIYVSTANGEGFFITPKELRIILSEFDFIIEKKKTRKWGHVNIDDWRVERFDEPRTY